MGAITIEQESLFNQNHLTEPLANRVRPENLTQFVGQEHLIGPGKILRQLIESDQLPSLIFWGPPGVGKTTLAQIIARHTKAEFITFSAVTSGIKELKQVMHEAEAKRQFGEKTVLFIDEIHRFNKAQQDAFLPFVERGSITLIGATTENPSFEINAALLSRMKVFVLHQLSEANIRTLITQTLNDDRAFPDQTVTIEPEVINAIANFANGDARTALNTLEMGVLNSEADAKHEVHITEATIKQLVTTKSLLYDKKGEEHYNIISALHKSMRNSDVDAAIYWLARMLEAGEDPLYVARRLIRFASEDIGMADSRALEIATTAFTACHDIGMPECSVTLTHCVTYLALAPKSNAIYTAYNAAKNDALNTIDEPVPLQIRNAPTQLMKELDYGKDYQYAHDTADKLTTMQTMPDSLREHHYYHPSDQGSEARAKERLAQIAAWHREHDPQA